MAKEKNKTKIWLIAGAIIVIIILLWAGLGYNKLVGLDNTVEQNWANVESQYQRRVDLIPNLVSTVKGYAAHEEKLFTEITEMRSRWQGAQTVDEKINAANGLEGAIGRLMVVVENYPELKASENFLSLQDELAGTENRVAVARQDYNGAVKKYNDAVRKVPTNIIASIFSFEQKESFKAAEGAEKAPAVAF